jgi:hypothetical protein
MIAAIYARKFTEQNVSDDATNPSPLLVEAHAREIDGEALD